jgi:hypothetical protein
MLGVGLIVLGAACMIGGTIMLAGWLGGKSSWFGAGVYDRAGESKSDRQALYLYFIALVIAPLLGGALIIAFGILQVST